eukprot:5926024-Prymnesium_polylepis.1
MLIFSSQLTFVASAVPARCPCVVSVSVRRHNTPTQCDSDCNVVGVAAVPRSALFTFSRFQIALTPDRTRVTRRLDAPPRANRDPRARHTSGPRVSTVVSGVVRGDRACGK